MKTNKHAELIKQYAEDCINHKRPWELWEQQSVGIMQKWSELINPPRWDNNANYRRKPKTYKINVEFTSDEVYSVGEVIPFGCGYYYVNDNRLVTNYCPGPNTVITTPVCFFKTKEAAQKWLDATKST